MRSITTAAVAALASTVALTGCVAQPVATPTPTPQPTFQCTPEAGGSAYACDQRAYDDMKAKDALYAGAEGVYRKLLAEDERLYRAGEPASVTIAMYARGAYLDELVLRHGQQNDLGLKSVGGAYDLVWVHRNADLSKGGSVVSLITCVDSRSVTQMKGSKSVGRGIAAQETLYFVREGQKLYVSEFDAQQVEQC